MKAVPADPGAAKTEAEDSLRTAAARAANQPLETQRQVAAECAVFAAKHALAWAVPVEFLPEWKDGRGHGMEFQLVADGLDAAEKRVHKYGAPHSDPSGNYMASVIVAVVERFFPWLRLVPATKDVQDGWVPLNAFIRHWGPRTDGHFAMWEIADSLDEAHKTISRGFATTKNLKRKWRLERMTKEALGRLDDSDMRKLAGRIAEAHTQLSTWGKSWAQTPEAKTGTPGAEESIKGIRKWVEAELLP
eukprot:gene666-8138_t